MQPSKLFFVSPGPNEIGTLAFQVAEAVLDASLDRVVSLGGRGVRAGLEPTFVTPNGFVGTSLLEGFLSNCLVRGLAAHLLFYPAPQATQPWKDFYGGLPEWNDSVTGPLPNNRRPPSGLSNQVWDEIGRQLQVYIDAAHDAWTGDPDDLTFEFANEPWCGGAFGLEVGLSTAVEGVTKVLERGDLDNAFHDLAKEFLDTNPLDFHGHKVYAPAIPSAIPGPGENSPELDRQIQTMFYTAATYDAYRNRFDAWSFNVYPRLTRLGGSSGYPAVTGFYPARQDVVERATRILGRLRSSPASGFVGSKPIAIQETGVSAFLGGFMDRVGPNDVLMFERPYWYQEQGRYLAAMLPPLMGLNVNRVGVYALVAPFDDGSNSKYFVEEGSYALMERAPTSGGLARRRATMYAFGRGLGRTFATGLTWVLRPGKTWLDGAPPLLTLETRFAPKRSLEKTMLIASLLTLSLLPTAMADRPVLIPILPPAGFARLFPQAVSADGSTVVGITTNQNSSIIRAFRWRRSTGQVEILSSPDGSFTGAYAVSGNGSIVVGERRIGSRTVAIRWDQSGIASELVGMERAYCMTPDASVIGGASSRFRPAIHVGGSTRELDPNARGAALAMTPDGRIVVGDGAFMWDETNGFRYFLGSEFLAADALCISDDGAVVGGFYDDLPNRSLKAFLWRNGRAVRYLPELPAQNVRAVSGDGFIVLGSPSTGPVTSYIVLGSSGPLSLDAHLRSLGTTGLDEWGGNLLGKQMNSAGTALTGQGNNRDGILAGWLVVGNLRGNHVGARTSPATRTVDPE
jgi:uncharacterized membrane protein